MFFTLLYSVFAIVLHLLATPLLLLFSFKTKYKNSLPARFFLWKNPSLEGNGIWFHTCSFGEAKAIAPFTQTLPKEQLRMTSTTYTGFDVLKTYTQQSRYLPFESLLWVWQKPQKVLVVMEAEFWYLMFWLAKKRGAKTVLINARMSDRSYVKYYKMRWFYKRLFANIDEVFAQTNKDKERLSSLGANNITVTGNIKLANLPKPNKALLKPNALLVCAASTHEGEEALILEAFSALRKVDTTAKLVVAPRHPERFDGVAKLLKEGCKKEAMSFAHFSSSEALDTDVILLDKLGELVNIYAVSDVVVIGGSFVPVGGHNAAEAAQLGCKILSGEHIFNQCDIYSATKGIKVVKNHELTDALLAHHELESCSITTQVDLHPILQSIQEVV